MDEKQLKALHPGRHSRVLADGVDHVLPEGSTLHVGNGGDVCVDALADPDGTQTILANVPDGTMLEFVVIKKVYASGTTATGLVSVW